MHEHHAWALAKGVLIVITALALAWAAATDSFPKGQAWGFRRTPSLWNVAYNRWYFWDGRADTLWSQALKPMEDRNEMNGSRVQVAFLVSTDPDLRLAYTENFITSGCPLLTPRCREMQDALAESMH
jgi:cytochrome c peroxidase